MSEPAKLLIAGVGGQGVVFLTNLISESALKAEISVASSEIHGLAQRRGSVVAGITFGENSFGYIEDAGVDYLIGLEPMETQRCFRYLNRGSRIAIDDNRIFPHSVNAGRSSYPDVAEFVDYLKENIAQVVYNMKFDETLKPILRNVYMLGRAINLDGFPLTVESVEKAIESTAKPKYKADSLKAFKMGWSYQEEA